MSLGEVADIRLLKTHPPKNTISDGAIRQCYKYKWGRLEMNGWSPGGVGKLKIVINRIYRIYIYIYV